MNSPAASPLAQLLLCSFGHICHIVAILSKWLNAVSCSSSALARCFAVATRHFLYPCPSFHIGVVSGFAVDNTVRMRKTLNLNFYLVLFCFLSGSRQNFILRLFFLSSIFFFLGLFFFLFFPSVPYRNFCL